MQIIKAILIDDEFLTFYQLLESWLNKFAIIDKKGIAFEVYKAASPKEGEVLLSSVDPDIIILDLYYGSQDSSNSSFEFLRFVKSNFPDVPVLIHSSTTRINDLRDAAFGDEYQPDGFLSKSETINKGKEDGILTPDYRVLFDCILGLLLKSGRLHVDNGILITHGTDTMSWAFAILRYGLNDVTTNIVLTGSQLPLEGAFSPSDAIGNMLTSVKLLNKLVPPNIIQVFNDGVHIFNKNLNKVKKWSLDAFTGHSFGIIENDDLKVFEENVNRITRENKINTLHFIKTGGTIDAEKGNDGLIATADFTTQHIRSLQGKYFKNYILYRINPKDSSLFNPYDWNLLLREIESTGFAKADERFDWKILVSVLSPFMTQDYYQDLLKLLLEHYSGAVILAYGAGNVNIFGSEKTYDTIKYLADYGREFGAEAISQQHSYSIIPFLKEVESFNTNKPLDYKFIVMSSQVPLDSYDHEYQAGIIPLHYGVLPSGDLSYPEAQTKLAFILGHRELLLEKASENDLTYEQLVKSAFLSGIKFNREKNRKLYLKITLEKCNCIVMPHKKNLFVKMPFEEAIEQIIDLYK